MKRLNVFVVWSGKSKLLSALYRYIYWISLRIIVFYLKKVPTIDQIYLRRSMAFNFVLPGISDIDLAIVLHPSDNDRFFQITTFKKLLQKLRKIFPIVGSPAIYSADDFKFFLDSGCFLTQEVPHWLPLYNDSRPPTIKIASHNANSIDTIIELTSTYELFINKVFFLYISRRFFIDDLLRAQRSGINFLISCLLVDEKIALPVIVSKEQILNCAREGEYGDSWRSLALSLQSFSHCSQFKLCSENDELFGVIIKKACDSIDYLMSKGSFHCLTTPVDLTRYELDTDRIPPAELRAFRNLPNLFHPFKLLRYDIYSIFQDARWSNLINKFQPTVYDKAFIEELKSIAIGGEVQRRSYSLEETSPFFRESLRDIQAISQQ